MQYNDMQCKTRLWSVINPWIVPNRFRYQLSSQRTTCWSRTDFQSLLAASEDASFMDGRLRATAPVFPRMRRDCRPRWRPSSTGITPPFGRAMVAEGHFYYFNEARKKKEKSQRKWRVLSGCEKLILKQGKGYHPHNEDDWKLKKRSSIKVLSRYKRYKFHKCCSIRRNQRAGTKLLFNNPEWLHLDWAFLQTLTLPSPIVAQSFTTTYKRSKNVQGAFGPLTNTPPKQLSPVGVSIESGKQSLGSLAPPPGGGLTFR